MKELFLLKEQLATLTEAIKNFKEEARKEYEQIRALQREVSSLSAELNFLKTRIQDHREDISKALFKIADNEKYLEGLKVSVDNIQKSLTNLWDEFRNCQNRMKESMIKELREERQRALDEKKEFKFWSLEYRWKVIGALIGIAGVLVPIGLYFFDLMIKFIFKHWR